MFIQLQILFRFYPGPIPPTASILHPGVSIFVSLYWTILINYVHRFRNETVLNVIMEVRVE